MTQEERLTKVKSVWYASMFEGGKVIFPSQSSEWSSDPWQQLRACRVDSDGCLQSPRYPSNYRNSQNCEVTVADGNSKSISVEAFDTETGYDILEVNGRQYSGTAGPDDVVPSGTITWGSETCLKLVCVFPRASERRVLLIVEVCFTHFRTSSHLHIFSSSHLLMFTSSHLLTFSSYMFSCLNFLIFTSYHLHIFSACQLASSHPLIFTFSHFLILHLHTFAWSHFRMFSCSHLHTFSFSHFPIFTSFDPVILTFFHLHTFSFSSCIFFHFLIFTSSLSCSLALLPCFPLALFSLPLFYFSFQARDSANEARRNATLWHEMRSNRQKLT